MIAVFIEISSYLGIFDQSMMTIAVIFGIKVILIEIVLFQNIYKYEVIV